MGNGGIGVGERSYAAHCPAASRVPHHRGLAAPWAGVGSLCWQPLEPGDWLGSGHLAGDHARPLRRGQAGGGWVSDHRYRQWKGAAVFAEELGAAVLREELRAAVDGEGGGGWRWFCEAWSGWVEPPGVCRIEGGAGWIDGLIRGQDQGGVSQKPCNRAKGVPVGAPFSLGGNRPGGNRPLLPGRQWHWGLRSPTPWCPAAPGACEPSNARAQLA